MAEESAPKPEKTRIEWANHLIAFASSVLGILIGLSLDQAIQRSAETERRAAFLQTVDAELDRNTAELDSVATNAMRIGQLFFFLSHRFAGRFDMGGEDAGRFISRYEISKLEYDSLKNLYRDIIPGYERYRAGYWESGLHVPEIIIKPVATAWNSFNKSESIRGFDIEDLILYSRAYEQLEELKVTYSPGEDSTLLVKYLFSKKTDSVREQLLQIGRIYNRFTEQSDKTLKTIHKIRRKSYEEKSNLRSKTYGIL